MTSKLSHAAAGSADRIAPWHEFETRIRIRVQRGVRKLTMQGWSRNLSESGLAAFVAQGPLLGELVTLEVPLSQVDRQQIPARVVRSLGTEYGFEFTALSTQQRASIRAALQGRPLIPAYGG